MTAQAATTIFHAGEAYRLSAWSGEPLFDPLAHGLRPYALCSACWDGYLAEYAVEGGQLVLRHLEVNQGLEARQRPPHPVEPPPVAGRSPRPLGPDEGMVYGFEWRYDDLGLPIRHTGPLLIGQGDRVEFRMHGSPWPWQQQVVRLLRFEAGVLTHDEDVSERMAVFRQRYCFPQDDTFLDRDQQRNARRFLKRWTGLACL